MLIPKLKFCAHLVQECIKHMIPPNFVWLVRLYVWVYYRGGPRWRHRLLWILPDVSILHLGGHILSIFTLHSNQGRYTDNTDNKSLFYILLFTHSYIISIKTTLRGIYWVFALFNHKKRHCWLLILMLRCKGHDIDNKREKNLWVFEKLFCCFMEMFFFVFSTMCF